MKKYLYSERNKILTVKYVSILYLISTQCFKRGSLDTYLCLKKNHIFVIVVKILVAFLFRDKLFECLFLFLFTVKSWFYHLSTLHALKIDVMINDRTILCVK